MASDDFTNSNGTALETHNANYEEIDGTYVVTNSEINNNLCEHEGTFDRSGPIRVDSSEDSSQLQMVGGSDENSDDRNVAVRADNAGGAGATRGYNASFAGGDGTEWDLVVIKKNGGFMTALSKSGTTWLMANNHDLRIWVTGTTTVTIHASVDGEEMDDVETDSSSPIGTGHPGWWIASAVSVANSRVDNWEDGDVGGFVDLAGAIAMSLVPSAELDLIVNLGGTIPTSLTPTGNLGLIVNLGGTVPMSLVPSGDLSLTVNLAGTVPMSLTLAGNLVIGSFVDLAGNITMSLIPSGDLSLIANLGGTIPTSLTPTGNLGLIVNLGGTVPMSLVPSGDLDLIVNLGGTIPMSLTLAGNLGLIVNLAGTIPTSLTFAGNLDINEIELDFVPFIFNDGLPIMIRPVIFNFNFPQSKLPLIEVNTDSTASGDITILNPKLDEVVSLTGQIYLVTAPNSTQIAWMKSGSNLYSSTRLNLTNTRKGNGNIVIGYIFDPSSISGIENGQYFGIKLLLNSANDASIAQAGINMIMKIVDTII